MLNPRTGIPEASESPIAQINSHSKLATPRQENRTIWYENEFFKSKRTRSVNGTQNYTSKSRETIPLTDR
jgi:hypothetical protein